MTDLSGRKCPRHNCWIQKHTTTGNKRTRYCPRCDLERLQEEAKARQEAGQPKQKLKVITL